MVEHVIKNYITGDCVMLEGLLFIHFTIIEPCF